MPKRKKTKKAKGEILEKTSGKLLDEKGKDSGAGELVEQIKKLCENLIYISETDADISPFAGGVASAVTKEEILRQTKAAPDAPVEERDFDEIFGRLTEIQDWFGDEEKQTVQKFSDLRDFMKKNLRDLKVFKIGQIQLDVYAVGLDARNNLVGIKTRAVET